MKLGKISENRIGIIILFVIIAFFFIFKVGDIPTGLFCDEALIGKIAYELLKGHYLPYFISPFFYQHFSYTAGYLPIISTMPFTIFGLSDFTVRLSSAIYSLLGLVVIYQTLKKLQVNRVIPLLMLAFSPLFFHISRTNFGHSPSFFLMTLGLFFYLKYKKEGGFRNLVFGGIAIGISAYGYGGYLAGSVVFMACLIIGEIFSNRLNLKKYQSIVIFSIIFFVCYLPILYQLKYNPGFSQRMREKNNGQVVSLNEKITTMVTNYPKYYSFSYLFTKGELGMPNAFITRHSIKDNGIYLGIFLPILILGLFNLATIKDKNKKYFIPFFVFFLLMPLPDLLTTTDKAPPYSFSMFYGQLTIPFITAYALKIFELKKYRLKNTYQGIIKILLTGIIFIQIVFFMKSYYQSPLYSADYWGWQSGPKEIVSYFIDQKDNYDELYLTGFFNMPQALLDFYNIDHKCSNCFIGDPTNNLNTSKKQLFAVRTEELINANLKFSVKKIIRLPNQQISYLIIEPIPDQ